MARTIKIIGVGPGGEEYLTRAAVKSIEEAEVLVGGDRLLSAWSKPEQKSMSIRNNLSEVTEFIKGIKEQSKIVVLASGDPGMYGILNFLLRHFPKDELEVVPGLSSIQLAAARLKTSWHDGIILSVHGRPLEGLLEVIKGSNKAFILTDPTTNPAQVARFLLAKSVAKKATVCSNLSYPNEEVKSFSLEELAGQEQYQGCVLVLEALEGNCLEEVAHE